MMYCKGELKRQCVECNKATWWQINHRVGVCLDCKEELVKRLRGEEC